MQMLQLLALEPTLLEYVGLEILYVDSSLSPCYVHFILYSTNPVQSPVQSPVQTPVQSPVQSPVQTLVQSLVQTLVQSLVQTPVQSPVQTLVQSLVQTLVQTPVQSPVQSPAFTTTSLYKPVSLVPRLPPFFVLRFAFSIIHGSGRARKMGKAWEHLSRE